MNEEPDRDPDELEQRAIGVGALATGLEAEQVAEVINAVAPLLRRAHTHRMVEATRKLEDDMGTAAPARAIIERTLEGWLRSSDRN
jgi:hypothetical protein